MAIPRRSSGRSQDIAFGSISNELERMAFHFGTAAVSAAGLAQSVQLFRELQKQLNLTNSVAGGTAETFKQMDAAVRQFALGLRFTAAENANALYFLASAGFSVEQSLQAMTGVMTLAQATLEDVNESADLVASTLQSFALSADQAARVANVFAASITQSQADMPKLAYALRQVGPVAGSLGVSIEQTTAALSTMFNVGLRGEQAGTALRNVMVSIISPAGEAAALLETLGLKTTDAEGKFRDFKDILEELASFNLSDTDLAALFGREALAGGIGLLEAVRNGQFDKFVSGFTGTNEAMRVALDQMNSLDGAMRQASNAVDELRLRFAEGLSPILMSILGDVTDIVIWFTELDDATIAYVGTLTKFVAVMGIGGYAIKTMAGLVMSLGSLVLKSGIKPIADLTKALLGLSAASAASTGAAGASAITGIGAAARAAAGPIGLLTFAVGGLVAALWQASEAADQANFEKVYGETELFADKFIREFRTLDQMLKGAITPETLTQYDDSLKTLAGAIKKQEESVKELQRVFDLMEKVPVTNATTDTARRIRDQIAAALKAGATDQQIADQVRKGFKDAYLPIIDAVTEINPVAANEMRDRLLTILGGENFYSQVLSTIHGGVATRTGSAQDLINLVSGALGTDDLSRGDVMKEIEKRIAAQSSDIDRMIQAADDAKAKQWERLKDHYASVVGGMYSYFFQRVTTTNSKGKDPILQPSQFVKEVERLSKKAEEESKKELSRILKTTFTALVTDLDEAQRDAVDAALADSASRGDLAATFAGRINDIFEGTAKAVQESQKEGLEALKRVYERVAGLTPESLEILSGGIIVDMLRDPEQREAALAALADFDTFNAFIMDKFSESLSKLPEKARQEIINTIEANKDTQNLLRSLYEIFLTIGDTNRTQTSTAKREYDREFRQFIVDTKSFLADRNQAIVDANNALIERGVSLDIGSLIGSEISAENATYAAQVQQTIESYQQMIEKQQANGKEVDTLIALRDKELMQLEALHERNLDYINSIERIAVAQKDAANAANEWFRKNNELTGSLSDGITYAANKIHNELPTAFQNGADMYQEFYDGLVDAGTGFFSSMFREWADGTKSMGEILRDTLRNMLLRWADYFANLAMKYAADWIARKVMGILTGQGEQGSGGIGMGETFDTSSGGASPVAAVLSAGKQLISAQAKEFGMSMREMVEAPVSMAGGQKAAFLDAIASVESGGRYNVRYGGIGSSGKFFDPAMGHPNVLELTPSGLKSSAAGAYQIVGTTAKQYGYQMGTPFTPDVQRDLAWKIAQDRASPLTGGDLEGYLAKNGFDQRLVQQLGPTWEGLKVNPSKAMETFNSSLGKAEMSLDSVAQTSANVADVMPKVATNMESIFSGMEGMFGSDGKFNFGAFGSMFGGEGNTGFALGPAGPVITDGLKNVSTEFVGTLSDGLGSITTGIGSIGGSFLDGMGGALGNIVNSLSGMGGSGGGLFSMLFGGFGGGFTNIGGLYLHSGGVAGGNSNNDLFGAPLKPDEVYAKLQKGELILTEEQQAEIGKRLREAGVGRIGSMSGHMNRALLGTYHEGGIAGVKSDMGPSSRAYDKFEKNNESFTRHSGADTTTYTFAPVYQMTVPKGSSEDDPAVARRNMKAMDDRMKAIAGETIANQMRQGGAIRRQVEEIATRKGR